MIFIFSKATSKNDGLSSGVKWNANWRVFDSTKSCDVGVIVVREVLFEGKRFVKVFDSVMNVEVLASECGQVLWFGFLVLLAFTFFWLSGLLLLSLGVLGRNAETCSIDGSYKGDWPLVGHLIEARFRWHIISLLLFLLLLLLLLLL